MDEHQFIYVDFWSSLVISVTFLNPACGGAFFTIWLTIAKVKVFNDLNRSDVARALRGARAMELSMARGGDGKRT